MGIAAVLALVVATGLLLGCGGDGDEPDPPFADAPTGIVPNPKRIADERPNVIVIVTDDETAAEASPKLMPNTWKLLGKRGVRFSNFVISSPLCCPSRAIHLTGNYGHNNGVLSNEPGYARLRDKGNVLPAWLQAAGYRTSHVGKFLNGYRNFQKRPAAVAPGWDDWYTLISDHYREYNISINGKRVERQKHDDRYSTDELTDAAVSLIEDYSDDPEPFYLHLDQIAPHSDAKSKQPCENTALPRSDDIGSLGSVALPRTPSFNERAIADKPSFIARQPRLSKTAIAEIDNRYHCRIESLQAVDRGVAKIVRTLRQTKQKSRTVILFYSDNGFFLGEHRIAKSKGLPYEESIQVPLFAYLPKSLRQAAAPPVLDDATASIDLAPTILDLANAKPCTGARARGGECRRLDGRSLLPLLDGRGDWPSDRTILLELSQRNGLAGGSVACDYHGIRTADGQVFFTYTRIPTRDGERCRPASEIEHYDLNRDPYELHDLAADGRLSAPERQMAATARRLQDCSGIAGREPPLSGRPFCE